MTTKELETLLELLSKYEEEQSNDEKWDAYEEVKLAIENTLAEKKIEE